MCPGSLESTLLGLRNRLMQSLKPRSILVCKLQAEEPRI
ncbi:hypothetical protein LEMLEM_LOCUS6873 [Lemmus lemmus]